MTTEEYRAHPACNFSSLKALLKSPAHYQAALQNQVEETVAMRLGTLVHGVVLEGHDLNAIAAIKPEGLSMATKDGKAWKEAAGELPIISLQDACDIEGMSASILANPHAAHILNISPERETPLFSTLQGVPCKALLDAHGTDGEEWWIVDLKTTDDASPDAFARKVANFHYDLQAELYNAILSRHHQIENRPYWLWIAVEKTPPYTCAVYNANEWRQSGEEKLDRVLQSWKECTEKNEWPQPWQGINSLPKPKWA